MQLVSDGWLARCKLAKCSGGEDESWFGRKKAFA